MCARFCIAYDRTLCNTPVDDLLSEKAPALRIKLDVPFDIV